MSLVWAIDPLPGTYGPFVYKHVCRQTDELPGGYADGITVSYFRNNI